MRSRRAVLLLLVLLAGCAVPVDVETNAGTSTARLKTWSWLPRPPVARGEAEFAAVDARVRAAVERELGARRLRKVERERPDFLVTYYAAIEKPIDASSVTYAAGTPLLEKPVMSYAQGSLLIDVIDARTGKLVWRGTGRSVFSAKQTPDERNQRVDEAIASVVDQFAQR